LEKDKSRRYASAAGLAGDIRRHLNDEPIIARPASARYQLQKFARRHKALVAGVGAVFMVLIAGIIASTWEATHDRRAEQAARTESAAARESRAKSPPGRTDLPAVDEAQFARFAVNSWAAPWPVSRLNWISLPEILPV
jgi:eukaryotic-like serine/threonine-protein kinase